MASGSGVPVAVFSPGDPWLCLLDPLDHVPDPAPDPGRRTYSSHCRTQITLSRGSWKNDPDTDSRAPPGRLQHGWMSQRFAGVFKCEIIFL